MARGWHGDTAGHRAAAKKGRHGSVRRRYIPRDRYKTKAELPHVEYGVLTKPIARSMGFESLYNGSAKRNKRGVLINRSLRYANVSIGKEQFGGMLGKIEPVYDTIYNNGKLVSKKLASRDLKIFSVSGARKNRKITSPTLEPGISALTAAARMTPRKGRMIVKGAIPTSHSFYELTGGTKVLEGSTNFHYSEVARKRLAGRRIVRVRRKK